MSIWDLFWRGRTPRLGDGAGDLAAAVRVAPGPTEQRSIRPIDTVGSFEIGRARTTTWTEARAISDGLKVSSWVYYCITLIARAASRPSWIVEQRRGRQWSRVEGHALEALLSRPNPYWTGEDLVERLVMHLLLSGNAVTTKVRDGRGEVGELWMISPDLIKPVVGGNHVDHYEYRKGGKCLAIDPLDVIHGMLANPGDPWWGLSPMQAASRAIDSDVSAGEWNYNLLQRSIAPSGILNFTHPLSDEQWARAKAQYQSRKGSSFAGELLVFDSEAKLIPLDRSPKDMDWVSGRQFTREEIAITFNVPLPLVSQDASTFNNMATARRILWRDNVGPLLNDIAQWFNQALVPEFGADLRVRPDLSEIDELTRFTKENLEAAKQLWEMGVSLNRIDELLRLGLGQQPGGDVGYVAANRVPITTLLADPGGNDGL